MTKAPKRSVSVEILPTRKFREKFLQCVGRSPISIRVVSPFIGSLPAFRDIVNFSRIVQRYGNCKFQLVTRPPTTSTDTLTQTQAEAIVRLGVDLRIRKSPWLHSKIYYFEFREGNQTAFVGSANFTLGGFSRNDETMAMLRDSIDNKRVHAELERLSGRGAVPYSQWRAWGQQNKRRLPHG